MAIELLVAIHLCYHGPHVLNNMTPSGTYHGTYYTPVPGKCPYQFFCRSVKGHIRVMYAVLCVAKIVDLGQHCTDPSQFMGFP